MKKSSHSTKKVSTKGQDKYQVGKSLPVDGYYRGTQTKKQSKPSKKLTKKKLIFLLIIIILVVSGVFGFLAWDRIKGVFKGSLFDLIAKNEPLQRDRYGRSNILVFGTSEDDEGHSGATLADSIMIISVNQDSYDANMVSIPRDLWVKLNSKCPSIGTEQKINASYACALQQYNDDEHKASRAFADKIQEIIGTDIQYYAKVNYTVVKSIVDSLNGIDVTINSDDPRGIYDPATKIKFSNGVHKIDGNTALELSRSRGAFGGYGFSRSNFDRERNQQAIVRGILNKSTSSGTLANPAKVLAVFGSLGDNIISNIETKNLKTIVSIANNTSDDKVVSLTLSDKDKPLVTGGTYRGLSVVRPVAGVFDYTKINAYISQNFARVSQPETGN